MEPDTAKHNVEQSDGRYSASPLKALQPHFGFSRGKKICYIGQVSGRSSVVERQLPKLNVVGSIPIARSIPLLRFRSGSAAAAAIIEVG